MKKEKSVNYKHIGEVLYRKNARARNISIRISSKGELKVTIPGWSSFEKAESFVLEKEDWIIKKRKKIKERIQKDLAWKAGDDIATLRAKVSLISGEKDVFSAMQADNNYLVELPRDYDPLNEEYREVLLHVLSDIGLFEARRELPSILHDLSVRHRLPYTKVSVRRMRTRWGSCSSTNNISLNSALIFLPMELVEYVCLHELMHTIHKNHSAEFWTNLEKILPGTRVLRKKLHEHVMIA